MARVAISKRVRFEVFKRDSFACQYCGRKSPDVVLHVDHINPVKRGGKNDMMNLVTSCIDCNLGKSDKVLSDNSALEKQRAQLDQLSERREQLEMMVQWRDGLAELEHYQLDVATEKFNNMFSDWHLSDTGKKSLKSLIKKHGIDKVLELIPDAYEKATKKNRGKESVDGTLSMIGMLVSVEFMDPKEKTMRYIRGILKNRFGNIPMNETLEMIRRYADDGYCLEDLMRRSKNGFNHYTHFTKFVEPDPIF